MSHTPDTDTFLSDAHQYLQTHRIQPLMQTLYNQVLIHQPSDVITFLLHQLESGIAIDQLRMMVVGPVDVQQSVVQYLQSKYEITLIDYNAVIPADSNNVVDTSVQALSKHLHSHERINKSYVVYNLPTDSEQIWQFPYRWQQAGLLFTHLLVLHADNQPKQYIVDQLVAKFPAPTVHLVFTNGDANGASTEQQIDRVIERTRPRLPASKGAKAGVEEEKQQP